MRAVIDRILRWWYGGEEPAAAPAPSPKFIRQDRRPRYWHSFKKDPEGYRFMFAHPVECEAEALRDAGPGGYIEGFPGPWEDTPPRKYNPE